MTEKRVRDEGALAQAAAMLARLIESETHRLVLEADAEDADRKAVATRAEGLAKAGRAIATLAQTLERASPSAPRETQEDEGMNDDHAEFDALPIERKRAEIHRILDRMVAERRSALAGGDGQRGAEASAAALESGGEERAAAA